MTDPYFKNVTLLMALDSFDPRSYEQFIRIDSNGGNIGTLNWTNKVGNFTIEAWRDWGDGVSVHSRVTHHFGTFHWKTPRWTSFRITRGVARYAMEFSSVRAPFGEFDICFDLTPQSHQPFIEINSDYGRIGPFEWVNSNTMPHVDWCSLGLIRRWGGIAFGREEGTCIGEVVKHD